MCWVMNSRRKRDRRVSRSRRYYLSRCNQHLMGLDNWNREKGKLTAGWTWKMRLEDERNLDFDTGAEE